MVKTEVQKAKERRISASVDYNQLSSIPNILWFKAKKSDAVIPQDNVSPLIGNKPALKGSYFGATTKSVAEE